MNKTKKKKRTEKIDETEEELRLSDCYEFQEILEIIYRITTPHETISEWSRVSAISEISEGALNKLEEKIKELERKRKKRG
jgi:hypothetical protein